ncbi:hypothetical protein AMTR_s00011p00259460 [Amborella trichopoda]|uniref:Uncharacterized protein n=1 Tax=Amborella trichopoda TaxID=13333 RepID=W1NG51_AMBTC|nr:hypothetical protein AMTR_s00011p00259460 [Amborella trichopoda]
MVDQTTHVTPSQDSPPPSYEPPILEGTPFHLHHMSPRFSRVPLSSWKIPPRPHGSQEAEVLETKEDEKELPVIYQEMMVLETTHEPFVPYLLMTGK